MLCLQQFTILGSEKIELTGGLATNSIKSKSEIKTNVKYDYGLYQKLSYSIPYGQKKIMPYLELGLARGKSKYEQDFNSNNVPVVFESSFPYTKLSASLGAQIDLASNILPFFKYTYSRGKYSKDSMVTGSVYGKEVYKQEFKLAEIERPFTSNAFVLGVGIIL